MTYLLLSLIILGVLVACFRSRREETPIVAPKGDCASCDGTPQTRCEQDCMMEAATREPEYFDDEELDQFKGRPSDAYTDDEAEMFRDVMLTMKQHEVAEWGRSLRLREISLPDQVKDEYALLVAG